MNRKTITIFGTGKAGPGDQAYITACEVGRLLAQAGFTIANGGYGGTMTAAAKGASEAGGEVIGVTCSAFKKSRPNEYITREIVTHSLQERLNKLIELGAGYIVLPGGTGTLLELAHVWELKNKGFLNHQKPLIIIGGFWRPLFEIIAGGEPNALEHVQQAGAPSDAVRLLCNIMKSATGGKEES
jgi:uncharacterized protein (TIGR00730 family)